MEDPLVSGPSSSQSVAFIRRKTETIDAFNKFLAGVEMRLEPRFSGQHFLLSDEHPEVQQQLLNGEWHRSA